MSCRHCGSDKGFWFRRSDDHPCDKMHYICEECGEPDCDCDKCEDNKERNEKD